MHLRILLLASAITSLAAPLQRRQQSYNLTLPSKDPWYQPPVNLTSRYSPGSIIRQRAIPIPALVEFLAPGQTETVWQILYRSTDDSGDALAVATTLFVPRNATTNDKFFTQSIAYDSSDVDCSPSYTLQSLPDSGPDSLVIALAISNGWYVQSPDFESYSAAFTNGIISGQTMLDSLRAVKNSAFSTGISSHPLIALNGGSGGALAVEWALELQPTYAPDVAIVGATLGSLTPNIANVMRTVNKGPFAGLIPSSLTGLAQASSELRAYFSTNLIADTAAEFLNATTHCINTNQGYYAGQDIASYFHDPDFLDCGIIHDLTEEVGIMGMHGTPQVPLYIYKGVLDEISPIADTDALYDKFCNDGAPSVTYIRNSLTGHETEAFVGFIGAYLWISDRFAGVHPHVGCSINQISKATLTSDDIDQLDGISGQVITELQTILSTFASSE